METVTGEQLYALEAAMNSAKAFFTRLAAARDLAETRYLAAPKHTPEREELQEILYAAHFGAGVALERYDAVKREYDIAYAIFHHIED